ncbi:MAG TPA: hypothetical protein VJV41_00415 [Mycobacterium sp.]|nr:hypothetical protein [Mycobacterium sp.]HKP39458.1 hypothetical protein [Mycobacterium sp.]
MAAQVHDLLHTIEERLVNDGFVTPGVQLALVSDVPEVIRITKHQVQAFERNYAFWRLAVSTSREAKISHGGFEAFKTVVACRIELKGLTYEGSTFRIKLNGVDQLPFVLDANVEIAEGSTSIGAPVGGFVQHLGLDIEALQGVLQAIHDVEHPLHRYGMGSFAKVIFHGDEPDPELLQLDLDDGGVEVVTESAGTVVRDHIFDAGMLADVGQQFAKNWALINRFRRDARLDERLVHYIAAKIGSFGEACFALGGDRQAVRINVDRGVHLPPA